MVKVFGTWEMDAIPAGMIAACLIGAIALGIGCGVWFVHDRWTRRQARKSRGC